MGAVRESKQVPSSDGDAASGAWNWVLSGHVQRNQDCDKPAPCLTRDVQLWNWNNWFYDPSSMNVVNPDGAIAPVNTIIFAVSDSEETESRSGTRPEGAADLQGQG